MMWFEKFLPKKKENPVVTVPPTLPEPEMLQLSLQAEIASHLVACALGQVGVKETSFNDGPQVEDYQKAVDGKAMHESWCLGFVQWCVKQTCGLYSQRNPLYQTEACINLWNQTPSAYKLKDPKMGSIVIWRHIGKPAQGHTGICTTGKLSGTFKFNTVEGNTNDNGSPEGDGVYEKPRDMSPTETLSLVGFIDFPRMLADKIKASKI